jgi:hypothetical protein
MLTLNMGGSPPRNAPQLRIAQKIATYESCYLATATHARSRQPLREDFLKPFAVVGRHLAPVSNEMRIPMREDDNIASGKRDALFVFQVRVCAPMRQQMVDDYMSVFCRKVWGDFASVRCAKTPWRGKLSIKENRAFQLYRLQDYRERIHANS